MRAAAARTQKDTEVAAMGYATMNAIVRSCTSCWPRTQEGLLVTGQEADMGRCIDCELTVMTVVWINCQPFT
jgi:hypothetical protein